MNNQGLNWNSSLNFEFESDIDSKEKTFLPTGKKQSDFGDQKRKAIESESIGNLGYIECNRQQKYQKQDIQ